MDNLGELIGEICKVVLPIKEELYLGNSKSGTAICTLGSLNLLKEIKESEILHDVVIVGRLFSENKGIDAIVRFVNKSQNVQKIVICGKDVWGHRSGHSLIMLHESGIDETGRIIGSRSPDPYLSVTRNEIEYFQKNIQLVNLIGETNLDRIFARI